MADGANKPISVYQSERERLSRQRKNGYLDQATFVRARENVNRRERAEIRRLADNLKQQRTVGG